MDWIAENHLAEAFRRHWHSRREPGPSVGYRRVAAPPVPELASLLFFLLLIALTFVF